MGLLTRKGGLQEGRKHWGDPTDAPRGERRVPGMHHLIILLAWGCTRIKEVRGTGTSEGWALANPSKVINCK